MQKSKLGISETLKTNCLYLKANILIFKALANQTGDIN